MEASTLLTKPANSDKYELQTGASERDRTKVQFRTCWVSHLPSATTSSDVLHRHGISEGIEHISGKTQNLQRPQTGG